MTSSISGYWQFFKECAAEAAFYPSRALFRSYQIIKASLPEERRKYLEAVQNQQEKIPEVALKTIQSFIKKKWEKIDSSKPIPPFFCIESDYTGCERFRDINNVVTGIFYLERYIIREAESTNLCDSCLFALGHEVAHLSDQNCYRKWIFAKQALGLFVCSCALWRLDTYPWYLRYVVASIAGYSVEKIASVYEYVLIRSFQELRADLLAVSGEKASIAAGGIYYFFELLRHNKFSGRQFVNALGDRLFSFTHPSCRERIAHLLTLMPGEKEERQAVLEHLAGMGTTQQEYSQGIRAFHYRSIPSPPSGHQAFSEEENPGL